jgi:hypothetical protein
MKASAPADLPADLSTPHEIFSKPHPDRKKSVGWHYLVSDSGPSGIQRISEAQGGLHGNGDGLWNINPDYDGPQAQKDRPGIGRKRAATSEALGSYTRSKGPAASSCNFATGHWIEPLSDNAENLLLKSPTCITETIPMIHKMKNPGGPSSAPTNSLMKVDLPLVKGKSRVTITPALSSISQNPLLAKKPAPKPLNPQISNIQNPNAQWLESHRLIPMGNNMDAPGYSCGGMVPASAYIYL